ncbi:MAG: hypothetical protein FWD55_03065 [Propionibacteriaceae bacterium]|nr:hypothetical protein [Propionibacteriaceae bacterium]
MSRVRYFVFSLGLPIIAVILGLTSGSSYALWSAQGTSEDLRPQHGVLGFAVTKDSVVHVSSSGGAAAFTIGAAEATVLFNSAVDSAGKVWTAVPFDVTMLTSSQCGMNYSLSVAKPSPASVLGSGSASQILFPVQDPSSCTVAAGANAPAYPGGTVTGIAPGVAGVQTQVDHWCLVVSSQPYRYENTASASGTSASGSVWSTPGPNSAWWTFVFPDPGLEPDVTITATPSKDSGCKL